MMISNTRFGDMSERPPANSTLKRVFDLHAEETITDEQVERVLAPVRKMILEGKFDRPRRCLWLAQPLMLTSIVASMAVMVTMAQSGMAHGAFVQISDAAPPLSAASANHTSALVDLEVEGAGLAEMTLINLDSMKRYDPEATGNGGIFVFEDIPEGRYRIMASPAPGAEGVDAGIWIVADGKAEAVSAGDNEKIWEGVDARVCQTK